MNDWKTKPILRLRMRESCGLVERADVDPVEEELAAGGYVEAADDVHQRRLARAGGAHDRDEVAPLDDERDAAEGVHLDVAHHVGLDDPSQRR